jgi:DHA3 family macrolide efflux protein-like MFS transporter
MVILIPQIVLGPLIGPFIDRWNRKKIMIYSDLIVALLTLVLVILFYTKTIQLWHIYVIMAGRSISGTFQGPAMMASFTTIVPEKHLTRAYGLNTMLSGLLGVAAPPIGAFLMEMWPMEGVMAIDVVTAAIAIGILLPLAIPQPPRTTLTAKMNIIGDMVQSFRYLWSRRGLANLFIIAALLNFFSVPPGMMFPVLVKDHLAGDVIKLGWLGSASGVGAILGGALIGIWGGFKKRIYTAVLGVAILGICTFLIGFTTESFYYFIIAIVLIMGAGIAIANSPLPAIMNMVVARDMQGRIFSLIGSVCNLMIPIGLAIAGPVADIVGIRWIYWVGGGAFFIILPLTMFNKKLMNVEKLKPEDNAT